MDHQRPLVVNLASVWRERGFQDGLAGRSKQTGIGLARSRDGDIAVHHYLVGYRGALKTRENDAA